MSGEIIVLTGSEGSFEGLAEGLQSSSMVVVERPLLRFVPPADWTEVDRVIARLRPYQAVAFTSPRAARGFTRRAAGRGVELSKVSPFPQVWAVGPATAQALGRQLGPVRQPASPAGAVGLARAMIDAQVGGPVLFPCGDMRRDELPRMLRQHGITVDEIVVYRTVLADAAEARRAAAEATLLVVASPSVIELLATACDSGRRPELIAVGRTTAAAAANHGWPPAAVARAPSGAALAAAITDVLARR